MTSKFEQLIEYVINDNEQQARELFHDIVVQKSREIYESLMEEDDAERDDKAEKAGKKVAKDIEYDEKCDESFGGDASDSLIDEVETEEEGMYEEDDEDADAEFDDEAEEAGDDVTADIEDAGDEEGDIEDRVVDLEDKLDELMAEFESLMGGDEGSEDGEEMVAVDDEVGGDAFAQDDTSEFEDEPMMENVTLAAAPKPTTTEPAGTNSKSPNANNSGAKGAVAKPVSSTGDTAKGRPAPSTKDLPDANQFQNSPGKDGSKLSAAPKPVTSQAAGVNTTTPFPKA